MSPSYLLNYTITGLGKWVLDGVISVEKAYLFCYNNALILSAGIF
jgi:hypothetical protein